MKFRIRFGNTDLLLTTEQLDAMVAIAEDAETWEESYIGKGKGYTGHENNYELRFDLFNAQKNATCAVVSTQELAKWHTLNEYRKQAQENDSE